MKTLTVLCDVVLFGFTCFVLATDGVSTEVAYIIFTLLLILIPIFTVFAIVRSGAAIERVAAICNIGLLGFVCWALVDQYPHPEEEGFAAFAVLTVLTPILGAIVLFCSGPSHSRRGTQMKQGAGKEAG
jgi:hypothetical protein